jgi:phosphonate transport system substrate-binding protein
VKKISFVFCVFIGGYLLFSPIRTFSKEVVPFGLCSKYNPRIMYQLYQPFVDYLTRNTPYQFEISLSKTYEETVDRLGKKEVPIAACGPVPYVKGRERYNIRPILRALSKDGKTTYHGIIIVRQDSPIQKIIDLKGKSFAFAQEWSTAGHILPQYHLARAKVRLEDLKSYTFLRHHDSVVQGILKRQIDAGAVKDVVAYQYQSQGIRFILVTDPTPTVPIVVRNDTPKGIVEWVKTALLKLNPNDPAAQKEMAAWDEEFKYGFTEASDSDYDPIRRILRDVLKDQESKGQVQAR